MKYLLPTVEFFPSMTIISSKVIVVAAWHFCFICLFSPLPRMISNAFHLTICRKNIITRDLTIRAKKTIAEGSETITIIKNSKFFTKASPASSIDEALSFVDKTKDPKASHNCWAYRASNPAYERFSDDGEPGGTAGRPILGALEASDVYDCVVLVTRYFGGVKLGTGGLVRAYASAAREALDAANKIEIIPMVEVSISTSSSQIGSIYHALSAVPFTAERLSESFSDDSLLVTVAVRVPAEREADLKAKVTDICKGSATFGAIAGRSDLS